MNYPIFVSCAKGLEYLLESEMKNLGLLVNRVSPQGVYGDATKKVLYQLCLWSRLANRIQLVLFDGDASDEKSIYALCRAFDWSTLFSPAKTLAVEFHGSSTSIRNSMFGGLIIKDAVVDFFRDATGRRPSVDKEDPDIRIHAHLKRDRLTVSFDLTGYSMHQRGYRLQAGGAPLKETVASALLLRANWPQLFKEGYALQDPFCGAGTLIIEAAMMAANKAPGLLRHDQSFQHWVGHDAMLWEQLRQEALQLETPVTVKIKGSDRDSTLIDMARKNAELAGIADLVEFRYQDLKDCQNISEQGLLVCNPPYGERMGEEGLLIPLYQQLGTVLHRHFQGWQAAFITSSPLLARAVGLRVSKQYSLFNGQLECKLYCLELSADNQLKNNTGAESFSKGAQMLANRLQKNHQHLKKWAKREHIECYRVYDADLPEYAFAIDLYQDYAVLQEYAAPADIEPIKAQKRSLEVKQVVPAALGIAPNKLINKERKQQKGESQYQKIKNSGHSMVIHEGRARLKVNLQDYLDTGLFLDHRPLRLKFGLLPAGTRFLNCFCYTATASVHAAMAGALTTNVDLSNTYLKWAEENFKLNNISLSKHQFIQFDCMEWLGLCRDRFDVIFLDPPSFSNSKRMNSTLDVQRDHESLIDAAMGLLNTGGVLYFSTNFRKFKLAESVSSRYEVKDITAQTIDVDFKRNEKIHRCFILKKIDH